MSLSETREFLEDLLQTFDPDVDLSDGSRAQTDLIDPILQRIGPDPFDDDIPTFILNRIQQVYPNLAITEEDPLRDTVVNPMRVIIEPLVREIKLIKLRASLQNIESLSDQEVDALLGNFFESRISGGFAVGVVRLFFSTPQSISVALTNPASTRGGLRFFPTRPQSITSDQMLLNVLGSEYYFDVNMTAENRGTEYNVEPGEVVSMANLPTATRVTNPRRFRDGTPRETSVEFAGRAQAAVSDKTLTVKRGIIRTLTEAFPSLRRLFSVGYRDPEMQRDVIKGGSLGPIPANDAFGPFYGTAIPIDDLDGDLLTRTVEATAGFFVSRLGSAGTDPGSWFLSASYVDPGTGDLVSVDARVVEVVSSTRVITDHDFPIAVPPVTIHWALRERLLTISDIPGGITLPDTAEGFLEIRDDEVHIGGKTDVYVAGETEQVSAQITSLTDESPAARGANGETDAALVTVASADIVILNDSPLEPSEIVAGWSLVFEEGVDAGSYRILAASGAAPVVQLTLDREVTGTQANLSWKIVDDITTELTDPKDIKLTGDDMVTAAGSTTVTTTSASNFIDARVLADDVLRLEGDDEIEGDYTITEVNAVTLEVDPPVPRTAAAVKYSIFRRSEAVDPPLVRISSLELLDSAGAPVGTVIPYRDPVLVNSRAFQNEGATFSYDQVSRVGLVSSGFVGATVAVGGLDIDWFSFDAEKLYLGVVASGTFTFPAGPARTVATAVAEFNADVALAAAGIRAIELSFGGQDYMGFFSNDLIAFSDAGATALGINPSMSNGSIRTLDATGRMLAVQLGDAVEILEGGNAGATGRIIQVSSFVTGFGGFARVGQGPLGPFVGGYDNRIFLPEVGVRVRMGRPSVGSARVYFLSPTSAEFGYKATNVTFDSPNRLLEYQPDPENRRVIRPAPPLTDFPNEGTVDSVAFPSTLTDTTADFLFLDIRDGDLLEILYRPIDGTVALPGAGNVAVGGLTLILRFDLEPFITISFPFDMPRQDVFDYINEQVGQDLASLAPAGAPTPDAIRLQTLSRRLEISEDSTALVVLALDLAPRNNDHPDQGEYIIANVSTNVLTLSNQVTLTGAVITPDTQYRILRYTQRISSTEMNLQQDATGLYYADLELRSRAPGNDFNIEANETMAITGQMADGYRLVVENENVALSRAEVLTAEISRTILLVGSSDSPEEYVQLSQQNVQVNYDRSQLTDEIQSFVDSDRERVVCEEILVKHLLPHYVNLNWAYVGGSSEPEMLRAINDELDAIEPDTQIEVNDIVNVLRRRGATSVYTVDADSTTGRRAPILVVVLHQQDRSVQAILVRDFINATRLQRYIPDTITLSRVSPGGIR